MMQLSENMVCNINLGLCFQLSHGDMHKSPSNIMGEYEQTTQAISLCVFDFPRWEFTFVPYVHMPHSMCIRIAGLPDMK